MTLDDHQHRDRVVPVYAFTGGRTRTVGQELPLEAVVTATELFAAFGGSLQAESRAIIEMCSGPKSLVEIGAALRVPVGVARVLVGDLANTGYLEVHLPRTAAGDGGPGHAILGRLLDGLRSR
ncbi:MAG TPA: DUF742 domain-containing protein [Actinomycetes bacterium]|jgi:hypothetical protein|nr:DUF742 domain-containing protein [Actinomycetes bacterium]